VQEAAKKAIDLIGGILTFIKPESKVLVKPNLLMAKEPEFGIDTHPEVVRAVVKILKEIECKIFIGDGPTVWGSQYNNVDEVYLRSGIKRVAEDEGIELVRFDKQRWRGEFPLAIWLDNCDHVVNIAKFKTHDLTILTGAIKNLFGLVPGTYKTELHKRHFIAEDFAKMLVAVYTEARPALNLVDGIVAMEGDGPATSGKLRNTGLLFASSDAVALDSVLALIMGLEPEDILTTKEAARRELGISNINHIDIVGEKLEEVIGEPFRLPATSLKRNIPRPIIELAKKLIRFYPVVNHNNCIRCQSCIKACPMKVMSLESGRVVINYTGCISCFCCQEACPEAAIKVKKSIVAKMIGL
jgi:uncharacterized protein (DUF362 family)/NAD-dependent dihydropyrimidine dehydrogenase PreA subunit